MALVTNPYNGEDVQTTANEWKLLIVENPLRKYVRVTNMDASTDLSVLPTGHRDDWRYNFSSGVIARNETLTNDDFSRMEDAVMECKFSVSTLPVANDSVVFCVNDTNTVFGNFIAGFIPNGTSKIQLSVAKANVFQYFFVIDETLVVDTEYTLRCWNNGQPHATLNGGVPATTYSLFEDGSQWVHNIGNMNSVMIGDFNNPTGLHLTGNIEYFTVRRYIVDNQRQIHPMQYLSYNIYQGEGATIKDDGPLGKDLAITSGTWGTTRDGVTLKPGDSKIFRTGERIFIKASSVISVNVREEI